MVMLYFYKGLSVYLFQIYSSSSNIIKVALCQIILSIVNSAFLMEFTLFWVSTCAINTQNSVKGSFNFLKNILVKCLRKQMYKIPFFPVFSISSEQWIFWGLFCLIGNNDIIDEPYVTLQIILNYVKCQN